MLLNSFDLWNIDWKIIPARKEHATEIASWIGGIDTERKLDRYVIAEQLSADFRMAQTRDFAEHKVGICNGQLMFYFNGYLKDRKGVHNGKIHKKKDYSISLIINELLPLYQQYYVEVWIHALRDAFMKPNVGRVITEIPKADAQLVATFRRLGFHRLDPLEFHPSVLTWFGCSRLDFAPYALLQSWVNKHGRSLQVGIGGLAEIAFHSILHFMDSVTEPLPEREILISAEDEKRIADGKELLHLAYLIRVEILTGQHEHGCLSETDMTAYIEMYGKVESEFLARPLSTSNEIIRFYLHARQELIEAQKACRELFPELFAAE